MEFVFIAIVWLIMAFLVGIAAGGRGRDKVGWTLLAMIISLLFAGLILALMPSNAPLTVSISDLDQASFKPGGLTMKKCPDCAEVVQLEARICRYCRHEFVGEPVLSSALKDIAHSERGENPYRAIYYKTAPGGKIEAHVNGQARYWDSLDDFWRYADRQASRSSMIEYNENYKGVSYIVLPNGNVQAEVAGRLRSWRSKIDFIGWANDYGPR